MIKLHLGLLKTKHTIALLIKFSNMCDRLRAGDYLYKGDGRTLSICSINSPELKIAHNTLYIPGNRNSMDNELLFFILYPNMQIESHYNIYHSGLKNTISKIYNTIDAYNNQLSNRQHSREEGIQIINIPPANIPNKIIAAGYNTVMPGNYNNNTTDIPRYHGLSTGTYRTYNYR